MQNVVSSKPCYKAMGFYVREEPSGTSRSTALCAAPCRPGGVGWGSPGWVKSRWGGASRLGGSMGLHMTFYVGEGLSA